jgi:hypothetical protein
MRLAEQGKNPTIVLESRVKGETYLRARGIEHLIPWLISRVDTRHVRRAGKTFTARSQELLSGRWASF